MSSLKDFSLTPDQEFEHIGSGPGVYLFEIRFPFKTGEELIRFSKAWGSKGATDLQKGTSRSYLKRVEHHVAAVETGSFLPFYIGKRMNVRNRVQNHLTGKADSGTYGLKLLSRLDILEGCSFRVGGVTFDLPPEAYFCVQFIEAELRKKLHPMVGKQ